MAAELDESQRCIVAALQIDGRAPWRKIAAVLGEPERSVARHGTDLLNSGAVGVVGLQPQQMQVVLKIDTVPGTSQIAVEALARRPDSSFSYSVSGGADCVAELLVGPDRLGDILALEVPAITGISRTESFPVLKYFQTIRSWRGAALTPAQAAALRTSYAHDAWPPPSAPVLSAQDQHILAVLIEDGRASYELIARRAGVSESTARRRVEWLLTTHAVEIRAVVEPSLLGLPVEALLWVRASPGRVDQIGVALVREGCVRYAAAIAGRYQILADVTVADLSQLYRFVTEAEWTAAVESVEVSVLLGARKRGGRIMPSS